MRDPRRALAFNWHEAIEAKLEAAGLRPQEIERMFANRPRFYRGKRRGTARWMVEGQDPVSGKWMRVGVIWHDREAGILRAVHGMLLTK